MLVNKVRVLTAMCAAAVTLSTAGLAHADAPQPPRHNNSICFLTTPVGTTIAYEEGQSISITTPTGKLTYTCKAGQWVQTYMVGSSSPISVPSGTLLAKP